MLPRTERRRGAQHMNDELYAELEAGLEGGAAAPDASRAGAGQTPLPPPPPARAAQPEPEGVGAGGFSVAEQLARLKAKESQQMPRVSYMSPAAEKETEGVRAWEGRLDASRRESGAGQAAEAPQASQEGAERAAVTVSLGSNVARMAAGGTGSEAELSHLQALLKRSEKARAAGCVSNPCSPLRLCARRDSLCHHLCGLDWLPLLEPKAADRLLQDVPTRLVRHSSAPLPPPMPAAALTCAGVGRSTAPAPAPTPSVRTEPLSPEKFLETFGAPQPSAPACSTVRVTPAVGADTDGDGQVSRQEYAAQPRSIEATMAFAEHVARSHSVQPNH